MAEEVKATETVTDNNPEATETKQTDTDNKPDVEELLARLAQAETRIAQAEANAHRLKTDNDKLSKENAERKRQARASMTAEEQRTAEIEEQIKALTERAEKAEAENNHSKAVSAYKAISDDAIVEELINAVADSDHAAIASIIEKEKSKAVKLAQSEWMKTAPPVSNGNGVAMTKEQIMAVKDASERQRLIAANLDLFTN